MQFTHQPETSFSILEFTKHFLTSSTLQTFVPPNLCLLLRLSRILNISNVSFSSNLNRLNTLRPYRKFVPINNAQNLSSGFIQQCCVVEINTAPQQSLRNGVLFVLAWVAWVACQRGQHASVGSMGGVGGVLAWVACYYYFYCYY